MMAVAAVLLHPYLWAGLILPAAIALSKYIRLKSIEYDLTSQRLRITSGLVSRKIVEVELFRIRDLSLEQSFVERLIGIGNIEALSSDKDAEAIHLVGVHHPQDVKEQLRTHVMESRRQRNRAHPRCER